MASSAVTYDKGNWGRWGKDDERGALNLVTPEVIRKAAGLVKQGRLYTLSIPIKHGGYGYPYWPNKPQPTVRSNVGRGGGGDDYISLNTHNQTHIDSLAHVAHDNKIFNGYSTEGTTSNGAEKNSIDKVGAIVTRGVLLDMPAFKGVPFMKPGEGIFSEDMQRCAAWEGVTFQPGDAILTRTGHLKTYDKKDNAAWFRGEPGVNVEIVDFIDKIQPCLIGADTYGVEMEPQPDGSFNTPVHQNILWKRGIYIMEFMDLETIARDKVYEFLFVAAPLKLEKALGSVINPVAIA